MGPSLLDLPDVVICEFLRYLDATSLYLLGRTCIRLDDLIKNYNILWRRIDARRAPNDQEKISYILERCYDDGNTYTHTLLLRADSHLETLTPSGFFPKINDFSKVAILALENQTIDGSTYNAMSFPQGLDELSLKKTLVTNTLEFFKGSGEHFKKLRVLILDSCDWVSSSAFMPISKYSNLEILSVYKCKHVENSIAYLSLSSQGFKSLKIFDARLSPLGNTLIRAIYRVQSLLAIYLQNEDITYKLDYFKRKLAIMKGGSTRDFFVDDDEFDVNDLFTNEENGLNYEDTASLDDDGLIDYLSVRSVDKAGGLPKSFLYLDPYNVCTCHFQDNKKKRKFKDESSDSPGSDDNDDLGGDSPPVRLVSDKIGRLGNLMRRGHSRGLFNNNHPRTPSTTVITFYNTNGDRSSIHDHQNNVFVMNLVDNQRQRIEVPTQENDNENHRAIINVYIRPPSTSSDNSEEPPRKRLRTEEPTAGPSGLARDNSGSESDPDEAPLALRRPPTPHPDIAINNPPNASFRIYYRDSPIVQIEDINNTHKDIKVPLRRLSLRGYKKITNSVLFYIKDLDLELLDLTYTSVSAEAIQNYLRSHPLCRIVHEKFCTCPTNLHF